MPIWTLRRGRRNSVRTKYLFSPEFQRQIWLNFTPFKLMAVPIVPVITYLFLRVTSTGEWPPGPVFQYFVYIPYFLIICILGQFAVAASMQEETKFNTWDFQRVSAISPAQLTFGKLFGSTAYTWFMAFALILFAWMIDGFKIVPEIAISLMLMTLAGLVCQAITFLCSLSMLSPQYSRYNMSRWSSGGAAPYITGLVISVFLFNYLLFVANDGLGGWKFYFSEAFDTTYWYATRYASYAVSLCSLIFLLGWLWIGCYRTVRAELMYRETPVVWAIFLPACFAWYGGFFDAHSRVFYCLLLLMHLVYITMLSEAGYVQKYKRLFSAFRARDFRRTAENLPKWMVMVPWIVLFYLDGVLSVNSMEQLKWLGVLSAYILIFMRDGMIVHLLYWYDSRRALYRLIIYFFSMYIICPYLVFSTMGIRYPMEFVGRCLSNFAEPFSAKFMQHEYGPAYSFFSPSGMIVPGGSIYPLLAQAVLVAVLFICAMKYKNRKTGKTT